MTDKLDDMIRIDDTIYIQTPLPAGASHLCSGCVFVPQTDDCREASCGIGCEGIIWRRL